MILANGKYYLYRHVRVDRNEPFYIGIGTKNKNDLRFGSYDRAHKISERNPHWSHIASKTKYEIEILLETDSYEFLKEKEKEFILLYGRRDLGTGTLVNMTNGGETNNRGIKVDVYDLNKKYMQSFGSLAEAATSLKVNRARLIRVILNKIYVFPRRGLIFCPQGIEVQNVEVKEVYNFRSKERNRVKKM